MKHFTLLLSFCFLVQIPFAVGQRDSIPPTLPDNNEDLIEDFIQNGDAEGEFDFNDIFEALEYRRAKPLNLNKADRNDLEEMKIISDLQINDFLQYRNRFGDLLAVEELQVIPSFDLNTINQLRPFVAVSGGLDDYQVPLMTMISKGKNEVLLRWRRTLEDSRGYIPFTGFVIELDDPTLTPVPFTGTLFAGNGNQYYARFKHRYENRLSYGVTMEKDQGEDFFKGSNPQGFDFYSAHFHLKDYNKTLKDLTIGDYNVSFGQGLILYTGFGRGKGAEVMNIRRGIRTLRGYSSVNEINFYRGAGATLSLGEKLETTVFGSVRNRDGNLIASDTIETDGNIAEFSSLQTTGLHRTELEIADENSIQQFVIGGNIKYQEDHWHVGFNALFNKLDKTLNRTVRPYSQFYFSGDQLFNASIDYSYIYRNINFFGETAISDNGALATTNGLLLGLDRKIDLAVLYRNFARNYQALDANPFAETSGARNEKGLYLGLQIRPANRWNLSTYFDLYQHPWLQFDADAPSMGFDVNSRLTYTVKRKLKVYLQVKYEVEEENLRGNDTPTDILNPYKYLRARLQFENKLNPTLELRTRIAYGFAKDGVNINESGFMIAQDLIFKPKGFPLSFTTRFAVFDTPSFNVRFYNYENDILNSFTVPPYYNKGTRFYFNVRFKGIRGVTMEARIAQTYWSEEEGFSLSTENEILGSTKTEVKAQVKYSF